MGFLLVIGWLLFYLFHVQEAAVNVPWLSIVSAYYFFNLFRYKVVDHFQHKNRSELDTRSNFPLHPLSLGGLCNLNTK